MATTSKAIARRRKHMTIPLAAVAGFVPLASFAYDGWKVGGFDNAGRRIAQRLTGIDSTTHEFIWQELMSGWGPILVGIFAHKAANKLGINRMLASAGIPLLRL